MHCGVAYACMTTGAAGVAVGLTACVPCFCIGALAQQAQRGERPSCLILMLSVAIHWLAGPCMPAC